VRAGKEDGGALEEAQKIAGGSEEAGAEEEDCHNIYCFQICLEELGFG